MLFPDDRLLFIDERHVADQSGMARVLNLPPKAGPCLWIDKPWERTGARPNSIVKWENRYRLYYELRMEDGSHAMAMAVSTDGVAWNKPDLDVVEFGGSRKNNIVDIGGRPGESCVFVDPTGPDEHRFKMIRHNLDDGGIFLATSPDGLRFTHHAHLLLNFFCDNHVSAFYDPRIEKYVILLRGWDKSRRPGGTGARMVVRAETDDLFKPVPYDQNAPDPWNVWRDSKSADGRDYGLRPIHHELPCALRCDEEDPEAACFYQAAAVQYTPTVYLAFPSVYYCYPFPPEGEFVNDGILDVQFASSADGAVWSRDFRGPYVRLDPPGGWTTKSVYVIVGMVPFKDRLSQYYVGGRYTHGEGRKTVDTKVVRPVREGAPFCHRLDQRLDGFVSLDSAYGGGEMTTVPFELKSPEIRLNIDTSASGFAHAALLAKDGRPLAGYGFDDCERIQGNNTQWPVRWQGGDLVSLRGRRIQFALRSRATKLYAVKA